MNIIGKAAVPLAIILPPLATIKADASTGSDLKTALITVPG